MRFFLIPVLFCATLMAQTAETKVETKPAAKASKADEKTKPKWKPLFKGEDGSDWKSINFGGEGDVEFHKDYVEIGQGVDLSGIVSTRKNHLKENYEIVLEARRTEGNDFFVGLTVPVQKSHCSLIVGGWGGGVCGISSLDNMDASENDTTTFAAFDNDRWYKVRMRVTDAKIQAWIDGENIVDVEIEGRKIGMRFEVEDSAPLGFSTYQSTAQLRKVKIRKLTANEVKHTNENDAENEPKKEK